MAAPKTRRARRQSRRTARLQMNRFFDPGPQGQGEGGTRPSLSDLPRTVGQNIRLSPLFKNARFLPGEEPDTKAFTGDNPLAALTFGAVLGARSILVLLKNPGKLLSRIQALFKAGKTAEARKIVETLRKTTQEVGRQATKAAAKGTKQGAKTAANLSSKAKKLEAITSKATKVAKTGKISGSTAPKPTKAPKVSTATGGKQPSGSIRPGALQDVVTKAKPALAAKGFKGFAAKVGGALRRNKLTTAFIASELLSATTGFDPVGEGFDFLFNQRERQRGTKKTPEQIRADKGLLQSAEESSIAQSQFQEDLFRTGSLRPALGQAVVAEAESGTEAVLLQARRSAMDRLEQKLLLMQKANPDVDPAVAVRSLGSSPMTVNDILNPADDNRAAEVELLKAVSRAGTEGN